ncbi:MAG: ABC transporter substrate-binding protein [Alphaproteobacteria bacterium]
MSVFKLNRRSVVKGVSAVVAGVVTAVGFSTLVVSAQAESLRVYVPSDPASIDPAYWGTSVDGYLMFNVMPRLASPVVGDEWVLENDIAESVDLSDPKNIKFTLKKGLQWANGYGEITTEDVKYSYERHLDEKVGSYIASEFDALDHVEIVDKYTGIIRLKYAAIPMWNATLGWYGGTIISKKEAEEHDGTIPVQPKATYGPYTFAEFAPGERMVLKAYDGWYGPKPEYDEIVMIPVGDANAAEVAYAAGEIDFMTSTSTAPDQLREQHGDNAVIEVRPSVDYTWIGINMRHPKLTDIRVRKAIQLGIDIPTVLAASYEGMDVPQATGFAAPGVIGYRPSTPIKYDPDAARALIQEAGAEGMTIELSHANYANRLTQSQIIQVNLAEIGLNVEINAMDESTYWDVSSVPPDERALTLKGWFGGPEAMYVLQTFTEDQYGAWNWAGYSSPEYDALLEKAWGVADDTERGEIYIQMQALLEESGAFLYLDNGPAVIMYRPGIVPGTLPDGRPQFAYFKKK